MTEQSTIVTSQPNVTFAEYGKTFQEKVLQALMVDKLYAQQMMEFFNVGYFELKYLQFLSDRYFTFAKKYHEFPTLQLLITIVKDDLKGDVDTSLRDQVIDYLQRMKQNPDPGDLPFIKEKSLDFCKKQALKEALEKTIDLVATEKYDNIVEIIKTAVAVGQVPSVGHDFMKDMDARFVTTKRSCVPTGYMELDRKEIFNGGLGQGELGVVTATCWCFTLNNPEEHGPLPNTWPDVKLMVYQLEEANSSTLHYQGYVEFTTAKRISTLKNINAHAHFEVRRGSRQQAIEYCMKEDTRVPGSEPVIIGTLPDFKSDKEDKKIKTSLAVKQLIDEGKDDKVIANEYFGYYIQSYRGLTQYRLLLSEERNFKTVVTVIYGPTGTGKSQWCWEHIKDPFWKVKGQWWDGYRNQGVVANNCLTHADRSYLVALDRSVNARDRKSTRLNSSHSAKSRMPSSA